MAISKVRCWEFKKCGREKEKTCPAVVQDAGRACWLVAGTLCGGKIQGTHAQKITNCKQCDYYAGVKGGSL